MEILALLLLGLIAMLAIVPPIIRGKLEESPLATTQKFQRSMQEMASSLEPYGRSDERSYDDASYTSAAGPARETHQMRQAPTAYRHPRRSRAAIRRSRIVTGLAIFASIWGVATLISGRTWCLVVFATASFLLVVYWALSLLVPYISSPAHMARRSAERASSRPQRQAM